MFKRDERAREREGVGMRRGGKTAVVLCASNVQQGGEERICCAQTSWLMNEVEGVAMLLFMGHGGMMAAVAIRGQMSNFSGIEATNNG